MNKNWLQARRTKYSAYVTVYILVILAVVVVANALADRHNVPIDVTANKRYSLSERTASIVKGLKKDVTITYLDQGIGFRNGKDLLDQYKNLSGRVRIEYVDVDKNRNAARAIAVAAGLQKLRLGTAIVQTGARAEEAKSFDETGITGAIVHELKGDVRKICFLTGAGEPQIDDTEPEGYFEFKRVLEDDKYQANAVAWSEKAEIPKDCTVLVVGGPMKDYPQPEVDAIKKYVEGGGRALFLLGPPIKAGRVSVADNDKLLAVLQSWGVTLDKILVADFVGARNGLGLETAVIPTTGYGTHAIVRNMKRIESALEGSRPIQIKNTDKTSPEKLGSTTEATIGVVDLSTLNLRDPKNTRGPFTIAVAGEYKTGKENSPGRFVVFGSANWVNNGNLRSLGNSDLAANSVNWLASDEDLITIRPKPDDDRPLAEGAAGHMSTIIWVSQAFLPLSVIVCGILVWVRRSRSNGGTARAKA